MLNNIRRLLPSAGIITIAITIAIIEVINVTVILVNIIVIIIVYYYYCLLEKCDYCIYYCIVIYYYDY